MERKTIQISAAVIACALVFRLLSGFGVMETIIGICSNRKMVEAILLLETGRVARTPPSPMAETTQPETEPTEEIPETTAETIVYPVFSQTDADYVTLRNTSGYEADVEAALAMPLSWDLTGEEPTVLIIHSHGTESYVNTEGYSESSAYRTLDTYYNVVSVGDRLAELLTQKGITVLHDRSLHDYPSYNGAYTQSREAVTAYLEQYPSIQLVLDLHRDAISDDSGEQIAYTLDTNNGPVAQMLLVLGTGSGGLNHPNWQENFALGVKLHTQLERNQPGICRPLSLRPTRFNQDLMGGMVLVEMGAAGNTRQEALLAAEILAQAICDLAHGSSY